ncbi:hypothetical protein BC943DRAFT_269518, partial [Umbelopsis sp. AD052]
QWISHFEMLLDKIDRHLRILSQRNLSVRDRALVVNSLALSRIWHCVRVVISPTRWITKLHSKIRKF